jgi:hypothetical protein
MEWQPIETAPKDGTKILVYTINGDIELTEWYQLESFHYEEIVESGLYRKVMEEPTEGWNSNKPVLWMPLPNAPK